MRLGSLILRGERNGQPQPPHPAVGRLREYASIGVDRRVVLAQALLQRRDKGVVFNVLADARGRPQQELQGIVGPITLQQNMRKYQRVTRLMRGAGQTAPQNPLGRASIAARE